MCDGICKERGWTIHYICNPTALSNGTCQSILSNKFNMRQTATKFVPRLLTDVTKNNIGWQSAWNTALAVQQFFCLQKHEGHPTPPLLTWFSHLWLLLLFQDENQVEGVKIWHRRGYPGWIIDNDTKRLSQQLPTVATTLGCCICSKWDNFERDGGD